MNEDVELRARDGAILRATFRDHERARGTVILAHAMFSRRTAWERGFSGALARDGYRSIAFDFRGHGESARTGAWGYDDLVRLDLPAVFEVVRERFAGPVIVVGHSLGGHVALAAQGIGLISASGIVGLATSVWDPALEPSRAVWALKRAVLSGVERVTRRFGRFPARALRLGSDDESAEYMLDLVRFSRSGWKSKDGAHDYLGALANVKIPVCFVASDGDRLSARPVSSRALLARCGGRTRFFRVSGVNHAEIVTTTRAEGAWTAAMDWIAN